MNLPAMQCDKGCGECCGPVFCRESEFKQVVGYAKRHGIEPVRQGITCPFYQDGVCKVYEVRPFICRVFGHFADLRCERGYNVNVSDGRQTKLEKDYLRTEQPTHFLHEAAYSVREFHQLQLEYFEQCKAELEQPA